MVDSADTSDASTDVNPTCSPQWVAQAPVSPRSSNPPNPRAENLVLYELQVRSANACDPLVGSDEQRRRCLDKIAPEIEYRAENSECPSIGQLERIRLGTLDDLMEPTTDFRQGITLDYIQQRVGANALWLMPLFPNNDIVRIPDRCDNVGSPYAVRDYWHARGTLSGLCIEAGADEYSDEPCWANDELATVLDEAEARDTLVLLDVAFNHFGHGYLFYDGLAWADPLQHLTATQGTDAEFDFDATFDEALLEPEVLDTVDALQLPAQNDRLLSDAADAVSERCPSLTGQAWVRAVSMWRVALPDERAAFDCDAETLEEQLPAFYLGSSTRVPSTGPTDTFTRDWYDVKFLFHRMDAPAFRAHALRNREYLFRVLNYWVAQGVDGFRLDHATNDLSGIDARTWRYLIEKVSYYAERRGQERPLFMAEEFHNQAPLSPVVDAMIEGYLFDMNGRYAGAKDGAYVESVLEKMNRFGFETLVNAHLENHDELRLSDGTGFDPWVGMGFWSVGAASWSLPMLLVGQEFGDSARLRFRQSSYLPGRFEGTPQYRDDADSLIDGYRSLIQARMAEDNAALRSTGRQFLRTSAGGTALDAVAFITWAPDSDPFIVVNNLWPGDRQLDFNLAASALQSAGLEPCGRYRAADIFTGQVLVPCSPASEWVGRMNIWMPWNRRLLWAKIEACGG